MILVRSLKFYSQVPSFFRQTTLLQFLVLQASLPLHWLLVFGLQDRDTAEDGFWAKSSGNSAEVAKTAVNYVPRIRV